MGHVACRCAMHARSMRRMCSGYLMLSGSVAFKWVYVVSLVTGGHARSNAPSTAFPSCSPAACLEADWSQPVSGTLGPEAAAAARRGRFAGGRLGAGLGHGGPAGVPVCMGGEGGAAAAPGECLARSAVTAARTAASPAGAARRTALMSGARGVHPRRPAMRWMCVSTAKSGRCSSKSRTQEMVLGPTPLNRDNSALMAAEGADLRCSRDTSPRSSRIVCSMAWMRAVLEAASPPHRMASCTTAGSAAATASQVGKAAFKRLNARLEFTFVVFCDRIVFTTASSTLRLLCRAVRADDVVGCVATSAAARSSHCRWLLLAVLG